jgi:hypothetical protein
MKAQLNDILEALSESIAEHEAIANAAMNDLEQLNPSVGEYRRANYKFGASVYVAAYLNSIKAEAEKQQDVKLLERRIRFHAHQQAAKSGSFHSTAGQAALGAILNGFVQRFFA